MCYKDKDDLLDVKICFCVVVVVMVIFVVFKSFFIVGSILINFILDCEREESKENVMFERDKRKSFR